MADPVRDKDYYSQLLFTTRSLRTELQALKLSNRIMTFYAIFYDSKGQQAKLIDFTRKLIELDERGSSELVKAVDAIVMNMGSMINFLKPVTMKGFEMPRKDVGKYRKKTRDIKHTGGRLISEAIRILDAYTKTIRKEAQTKAGMQYSAW